MLRRRKHQLILLITIGLIVAVPAAVIVARYGSQIPPLDTLREQLLDFLQAIPAPLYFLAFAILPALGVPLTLFYLTALPVLGQSHPVLGVCLAWLALAINMSLSNWLARGILHPAIEWTLQHRHLKIPKIRQENEVEIVLAVRLSPLPFAIQNFLLALGHTRWRYYLGLSLPLQGCIGIAMMFLGESILNGQLGYILLAVFGVLVISLLIKSLRRRLNRDELNPLS